MMRVSATSRCMKRQPRIISPMLQGLLIVFGFAQMDICTTATNHPSFGALNKQVRLGFSPAALFLAD